MSDSGVVRFKQAFLGKLAQREMPLLSHAVTFPDFLLDDEDVKGVLQGIDADLGDQASKIPGKRTGTHVPILGSITRNKNSSLVKAATAIGDQVDTDVLELITKGKGLAEAQTALASLKVLEQQLQQTVSQKLIDRIDVAVSDEHLKETTTYLSGMNLYVRGDGGAVAGAADGYVFALAEVLAGMLDVSMRRLGKMKVDQLFRLYSMRVVEPMNVARKIPLAKRATMEEGPEETFYKLVADLERTPLDNLGEEASDIVQLFKAAKISNEHEIRQARATKFTDGGVAPEVFKVKADGGAASCDLSLDGNARFNKATKASLQEIGKTAEGRLLFAALAGSGQPVSIHPPSLASAQRVEDGVVMFMNTGGTGDVAFDPDNKLTGADDDEDLLADEPWLERDPSIALYHELIHALIGNNGDNEEWTATDGVTKLVLSSTGDKTELRVVGLDYEMDLPEGGKALFPWSDPDYNKISENTFRRGLAQKNKKGRAVLRKEYVKGMKGQKTLDNHMVDV